MGKSQEVPIAIRKGIDDAKKNMFTVPLTPEKTLPHEILGIYGAGKVLLKPAAPGTGVIAGGPVRAVLELAGVTDVLTKSLGTDNAMNIVKAVAAGLQEMQDPEGGCQASWHVRCRSLWLEGEELMANAKKTLRITQVKSAIGKKYDQERTLKALGLGKIGRSVDQVDNPCVRGMIFKVKHLVEVEEIKAK